MNAITWCAMYVIVAVAGNDEAVKNPGITQFWTDDYKVFDQIYGRTSDKNLYGGTLPPTINYNADSTLKLLRTFKSNAKNEEPIVSSSQIDAYGLGNNFAHLRQRVKQTKDLFKPTKNANLNYNLYKPITEENDPETYDYFKHLEQLGKQQEPIPHNNPIDFQPYVGNFKDVGVISPYKSIQDILDAQDDKKHKLENDSDNIKYVNYPQNSRKKEQRNGGQRCGGKNQGRCRKRSNYSGYGRPSYRSRPRPIVRKIKHTIVTD